MKRVFHLLGSLEVGGKERVALQLARRARRAGFDHRLMLFDAPPRGIPLDLDPGDVPWSFVPRGPGLDLGFVRRVAGELRRYGADAVHAHNDSAVFYAVLAARLTGIGRRRTAVIGTFHTRPGHETRLGRRATLLATQGADAITSVSDELAELLQDLRWTRAPEVIWNGIDEEEFRATGPDGDWRRKLGVPDGTPLVGHVGRHDPVKRQLDLVDAARSLVEVGVALHLVFVGDGPGRSAFAERTRDLPWVRVIDRVADVAALLRALDVFVLCSSHEAAPRALMEAMSCGRACIATAVGGVPTLVTTDEGGTAVRLVPPAQPRVLAESLRGLLADESERLSLGVAARRRMAAFSSEREWSAYFELYARVCGR